MINEKGGSSHDPNVQLPPAMWERPVRRTDRPCKSCHSLSTGPVNRSLYEVPRAYTSPQAAAAAQIEANAGALGPLAFVCGRCDAAKPVSV